MAENKSHGGSWELAKTEEVMKGTDSEFRGARVRTSSAGERSVVMSRPLQKLFPLEVRAVTEELAPELEGKDNVAKSKKSGCSRFRVETEISRPVSQPGRMNQLDTGVGGSILFREAPLPT